MSRPISILGIFVTDLTFRTDEMPRKVETDIGTLAVTLVNLNRQGIITLPEQSGRNRRKLRFLPVHFGGLRNFCRSLFRPPSSDTESSRNSNSGVLRISR